MQFTIHLKRYNHFNFVSTLYHIQERISNTASFEFYTVENGRFMICLLYKYEVSSRLGRRKSSFPIIGYARLMQ